MYLFDFVFLLLSLLSTSLAVPVSTYWPGEVTNSSTTLGTTVAHGSCGVHIRQEMAYRFDANARIGVIRGYILDANHVEIGKLKRTMYGGFRPSVIEFHSRLDNVLLIEPGRLVQFELGNDVWNSTGGRCSVGEWDQATEVWGLVWRRTRRDMDCGFEC